MKFYGVCFIGIDMTIQAIGCNRFMEEIESIR